MSNGQVITHTAHNSTVMAETLRAEGVEATKANDSAVVHNTGSEAVHGAKTFDALLNAAEYDLGTVTTSAVISPVNGNRQKITLTHADTCALSFTQPSLGTATIQLKIVQSSVSTFNGLISGGKWPGGVVPTITATSGAVDILTVYLDGSQAYCSLLQNFR